MLTLRLRYRHPIDLVIPTMRLHDDNWYATQMNWLPIMRDNGLSTTIDIIEYELWNPLHFNKISTINKVEINKYAFLRFYMMFKSYAVK